MMRRRFAGDSQASRLGPAYTVDCIFGRDVRHVIAPLGQFNQANIALDDDRL